VGPVLLHQPGQQGVLLGAPRPLLHLYSYTTTASRSRVLHLHGSIDGSRKELHTRTCGALHGRRRPSYVYATLRAPSRTNSAQYMCAMSCVCAHGPLLASRVFFFGEISPKFSKFHIFQ
jgi:hypothetical protein